LGGESRGDTLVASELSGTGLELLKEAAPQTTLEAVLWNAANPAHPRHLEEAEARAQALGLQLHAVAGRTPSDPDWAFEALARLRPSALITLADGMLFDNRAPIVAFAT